MPYYRNKTDKILVLSKYNLSVKPKEVFYTPYPLPENLIEEGYVELVSYDNKNDKLPYTIYMELPPNSTNEINVKGYKRISIKIESNNTQSLNLYENNINDIDKKIELSSNTIFVEDRLSYEKSYVEKYIIENPNTNTETFLIRIDLET